MLTLDYKDSRSLHEQIEDGIRALIMKKVLEADAQLPSVRELSVSLTVNPNTVQKAYKQLEQDGYIYSVRGKGSFVAPASHSKDKQKTDALYEELSACVRALLYLGESETQIENVFKLVKEEFS